VAPPQRLAVKTLITTFLIWKRGNHGIRPFFSSLGVRGGHEVVVRLLLERGIGLNTGAPWGAVQGSSERAEVVVRLLLDGGAGVNTAPLGSNDVARGVPERARGGSTAIDSDS
jgi:hypothetical protein